MPDSDNDFQTIANIVSEPNSPYGQEYVSLLARTGKIDAYKEGRNWYTTKKPLKPISALGKENVNPKVSVFCIPFLTQSSIVFYQKNKSKIVTLLPTYSEFAKLC